MNLCGQFDQHLRQLEKRLGVDISNRGNLFQITGDPSSNQLTINLLQGLYRETADNVLDPESIHLFLQEANLDKVQANTSDDVRIRTKRGFIKPKGLVQSQYIQNIRIHDVTFGIGPAGTGKTWLAVACAVEALERDEVRRLILVRPAVEAGERLGFLPGDLSQKIDPYLRPMYDALYEMLGIEKVNKLIERNVIEVAPLAYMRGRTLNDAFILLDEAQNTTTEQMKMFLTRLGFGSSAVITGDVTQIDLPRHQKSGLKQAAEILDGVKGISFNYFSGRDVVRHKLVQKIVEAYDSHDLAARHPES
ncbi:MAG TPA: PhoH family protein [Candidatus Thiothrix moscowensis]|uniref:PhoH family protein n=1 Tax=unclassified Thiothrix TaxID=2636184 RepID=UPI001A2718CF|nr:MULTISPECIES: PhoH family protein [unclassified Thiothrix]MBJ6609119.1 PhoH family protein [Candidatus Thiothrix moscowensis]HRJ52055.1 PhoH family protein [Candidatus Thiothrix moscowensis]HRJ92434.1 PhoH family protein [Candidatus Thiothrix moscowensis]